VPIEVYVDPLSRMLLKAQTSDPAAHGADLPDVLTARAVATNPLPGALHHGSCQNQTMPTCACSCARHTSGCNTEGTGLCRVLCTLANPGHQWLCARFLRH